MFASPGDIAFSIFGFPVYWYGITMACAIFSGVYAAYFLYKKYYEASKAALIFDLAPLIILIGILGARLYYCLVNYSYYSLYQLEIFNIRQGGLSIHGMIITGIAALFIFSKVYKISCLKLLDVFLCAAALGQAIGRWGNFFNSEAFGGPTELPWKLFIPISQRPLQYINFEYFHPTFLYESILDLCIFVTLFLFFKRASQKPGVIACSYLIMYSFARIFVEHLRVDSALNISGIPVAQLMSICLIIFASVLLVFILNRKSVS